MSTTYKVKCDSCSACAINGNACHESGCTGIMQYVSPRGKIFHRYKVYSLDVWGNAHDGFEVNNRQRCGSIYIPDSLDDKDIIRALKNLNLLNKKCRFASFRIDGDSHSLMVDAARNNEPIYQLEAI